MLSQKRAKANKRFYSNSGKCLEEKKSANKKKKKSDLTVHFAVLGSLL